MKRRVGKNEMREDNANNKTKTAAPLETERKKEEEKNT